MTEAQKIKWNTPKNWKVVCFLFLAVILLLPNVFKGAFNFFVASTLCFGMWYFWILEQQERG